ncbi:MAG: hypothetical protein IPK31_12185 [Chitinophagaceae bacterium]|nr:hypothetical protein [Chitinophagaceae bacterium]
MKEKLLSALQKKPYFLVLLPFFFIAHGYNDFFGFFPFQFVLFNLIAVLFCAAVLYLLAAALFRKKGKNALFTFWLLLFMLVFGTIHDVLKKLLHEGFFSSYTFIIPFFLLLFIMLFIYLKKSKSLFIRSFQFLNLLLLFLLAYEIADAVINFSKFKKGNNLLDNRFNAFNSFNPQIQVSDSAKPDIYFLVFDAMPSTKAMKTSWNYDNSSLDSFLLNENFHISHNSKSNYNLTVLSVSSTLNMDYTPRVDFYQDETKMYFKAASSIVDNSLTRILRKEGYSISQYQSISFTNKDWKGNLFFKDMLYMNYFYKTLPGRIYRDLGWNLSRLKLRIIADFTLSKYAKRNKQAEDDLHMTADLVKNSCSLKRSSPQFIYAHFQLPHDPYIFDSTGKLKPVEKTIQLSEAEQQQAFIEQVKFANNLINGLVSHIKTSNKKIQSSSSKAIMDTAISTVKKGI